MEFHYRVGLLGYCLTRSEVISVQSFFNIQRKHLESFVRKLMTCMYNTYKLYAKASIQSKPFFIFLSILTVNAFFWSTVYCRLINQSTFRGICNMVKTWTRWFHCGSRWFCLHKACHIRSSYEEDAARDGMHCQIGNCFWWFWTRIRLDCCHGLTVQNTANCLYTVLFLVVRGQWQSTALMMFYADIYVFANWFNLHLNICTI